MVVCRNIFFNLGYDSVEPGSTLKPYKDHTSTIIVHKTSTFSVEVWSLYRRSIERVPKQVCGCVALFRKAWK
ncbi:hypothetical protein ACVWYN_000291 [Pedobacter sp. UYP24]